MYIVLGDEIIDSEEIKQLIEDEIPFKVEKDMTKGTKREDTLAYKLSIPVNDLNQIIKDEYDLEDIGEEDLFDEYMTLCDEIIMEVEEILPDNTIVNARSYKWDTSDDSIKSIITIGHIQMGELKLSDVTRRLLKQVD
ncbi:hypothetical protein [Asaccharospora irregularis]|uniref:Uncharacterized protein n=1 Tax=Asaccharospora irregularis DSM 2635 TaxID=1121321 RepID=A0A1M5TJN4_9FIRM|nr:hypothetical protein [Asaccharospora irregularis]SHH50982.1 hypothetical protein SAMN04488530_16319 [Asaccharospora irregularis DSM 2635]